MAKHTRITQQFINLVNQAQKINESASAIDDQLR